MTKLNIVLKNLTPRQRQALLMRYGYGWRMKRIALRMGTSQQAVSALIQRAQRGAGMPRRCFDVVRPHRRPARVYSLSQVFSGCV